MRANYPGSHTIFRAIVNLKRTSIVERVVGRAYGWLMKTIADMDEQRTGAKNKWCLSFLLPVFS